MDKTIGIIPAGGNSVRFKGMFKELLPIDENETALTRCIRSMFCGGADEVVIVTTPAKIQQQSAAIRNESLNTSLLKLLCKEPLGLWDVFVTAASLKADWFYFAFPDTVFPLSAFRVDKSSPVMVGTFLTEKSDRFGMLRDGQIVDKQTGPTGRAWGALILSGKAMELLGEYADLERDHTRALNKLLIGDYKEFELEYYYDFATFTDYVEFLLEFLCGLT